MTTVEGWVRGRWGWRSHLTAVTASSGDRRFPIPGRPVLEVHGTVGRGQLPHPGSTIEALVTIRGSIRSPVLVASSAALLDTVLPPRGIARARDQLARRLLEAAGTDVVRIRAAELSSALSVGRRDLLPQDRREGWRSSGLAHMLAVSGLHVGLLGAAVWAAATALGARPRWARICVLVALPSYAILSGASPSSVRAALMGSVYLVARLLGRSLIPMAAVLSAAAGMLIFRPGFVVDVGFQLTVLITAALVRWVPAAGHKLPGPRPLVGAIAVPIVAQLAAAPLVAWHLRTAIPGAAAANLLVPWLLAPMLLAALAATVIAPLSATCAALLLDVVSVLERSLWIAGSPGRAHHLVVPVIPIVALVTLIVCGWIGLQPGRRAHLGGSAWIVTLIGVALWWWRPVPTPPGVELLPVADGLAAIAADGDSVILFDGGRWREEAARLLADSGVGPLSAVLVSHTDEDHLGGVEMVLSSTRVRRVLVPAWMCTDPAAASLLRTARRTGAVVIPVARGVILREGATDIEVVWPPASPSSTQRANERSLVVRLRHPSGTVLITGDIGSTVEFRLCRLASLDCHVLVVPHHGSRNSCSSLLLAASTPEVALIPAGPRNIHDHPHTEVTKRLAARAIPARYPARDGRCGARYLDGRWIPFP